MKYIKGFDGLRAISIILVLLTHLGLYSFIQGNSFLENHFQLFSGATGVMIFFTISGFLITSLLLKEKEKNGSVNLKNFFIRRFLRLLPPLVLFYCTIALLMLFELLPANYPALLLSVIYLYNFVPFQYYIGELGHTWSLSVEEQFYFIWPFVMNRVKNIQAGLIFSLAIILFCMIMNVLYPMPIFFNGKPHFLTNYSFVDRWFIPACLPIMVGSFTSILLFENETYLRKKLYKNFLFLIVSLSLFVAIVLVPNLSVNLGKLLQPMGISCFLLWIYFNQQNYLVNALEFKPLSFLGKISYGVYVYQGLFLTTGPNGKLPIQDFPLNIILVFVAAVLSYFLIEKRIMKYKDKFKTVQYRQEIIDAV